MCTLIEKDQESTRLRASMSLRVKTSVCTRPTIIKETRTRMDSITFTYVQLALPSSFFVLDDGGPRVQTLVLTE